MRVVSPPATIFCPSGTKDECVAPDPGETCLDALPRERLREHQPYWAARARLLADAGRGDEARAAYAKAIGLTEDAAVREYLWERSRADPRAFQTSS